MVQFVSHLTLFLGAYGSWVCVARRIRCQGARPRVWCLTCEHVAQGRHTRVSQMPPLMGGS